MENALSTTASITLRVRIYLQDTVLTFLVIERTNFPRFQLCFLPYILPSFYGFIEPIPKTPKTTQSSEGPGVKVLQRMYQRIHIIWRLHLNAAGLSALCRNTLIQLFRVMRSIKEIPQISLWPVIVWHASDRETTFLHHFFSANSACPL